MRLVKNVARTKDLLHPKLCPRLRIPDLHEWCLTPTVHGHHTDVLLYNAAGDTCHITTQAGIKGVSTYDEVTDL